MVREKTHFVTSAPPAEMGKFHDDTGKGIDDGIGEMDEVLDRFFRSYCGSWRHALEGQ
jgi:hypothetical protein